MVDKDPAVYQLPFMVKVPEVSLLSEEELKVRGMLVNVVNRDTMHIDMNRLIVVAIPLIRIAEIAYNGYPVYTVDASTVSGIHTVLYEYLSLKESPNSPNIIKEDPDVVMLRFLAEEIFNINLGSLRQQEEDEFIVNKQKKSFGLLDLPENNSIAAIKITGDTTPQRGYKI